MTEIFIRPRAIRGYKKASKTEKQKIKEAIEILRNQQFPEHTKKLEGHSSGYRIRIGKLRILFILDKHEIDIVDIFMRKGEDDYRRKKV
ncbi:hypothetical protein HYS99_01165 [Candidatus Giovannonibacteria bacterium]|nr:hypothetical protein [Candidatus Giovannonibacteria bacterium]